MTNKMTNKIEENIQKLEEALSHVAQENHELSDMVAKQWKLIDQMELRLKRLENRLSSVEAEMPDGGQSVNGPANEKPPHY
ncbi:MAG: SlyX family protein [Rhodospirillaceae bacterium]|nr:SlyX family protein [Rhodospirillaceae bacterium]